MGSNDRILCATWRITPEDASISLYNEEILREISRQIAIDIDNEIMNSMFEYYEPEMDIIKYREKLVNEYGFK